jgi:hypothetical protein
VRDDTELERRLKALMGETPKFARADAPPPLPPPAAPMPQKAAPAPAPQAMPTARPMPAAPSRPVAPLTEVAPEEVVRAARQQYQQAQTQLPNSAPNSAPFSAPIPAAFDPKATGAVKPGEKFDVPMPQRARTQHIPVPPPKQSSWPLYILMAVGAALVAFALLRILLK